MNGSSCIKITGNLIFNIFLSNKYVNINVFVNGVPRGIKEGRGNRGVDNNIYN
jgi:hypothetical protein